ncbi:MAG: diacylglycerol kinase [Armatimonadetes bacterium]|nr:diacylglycerol kinase [Armatimonadota bacterium]
MAFRPADIIEPFQKALGGLVFTFKTQRHMRFHIYTVAVVLMLGVYMQFALREVMVLLFTASLVMVAEMFNSAIEATVDLAQPNYHPLAKFAKDIAAGAVLITTMIALVIGALLILGDSRWEAIKINLSTEPGMAVGPRVAVGVFLVFLMVVIGKGLGKHGRVLQGGLVSGHAAFGAFFATTAVLLSSNMVVACICVLLALIIAQSRWEAKFHTILELCLGATVGVLIGLFLFALLPK